MVVGSQVLREKAKDFRSLVVWQRSHQLVLEVYRITNGFPPDEKYGLVSQMRRAAISVPANLAEGFIKRGKTDKMNFYNMSQGSLEELKYYFILSADLDYIESGGELVEEASIIGKMLSKLVHSLKSRSP